ncbi:MAG: DUF3794 domain-containing protein [Desulfotomaculaceae bacterium]
MNSCPICLNETNPGNQCPVDPADVFTFTQIVINDNLVLPEQKPDIEHITNVTTNFIIEDVEVLDINLGGDPAFTGRKVVVAGTLTLGVEYSAATPSQEVHFAHFNIPFKALIKARPCTEDNRGLLPADFDISLYKINICIEHQQFHIVNPRELSKVLVVLIWLELI